MYFASIFTFLKHKDLLKSSEDAIWLSAGRETMFSVFFTAEVAGLLFKRWARFTVLFSQKNLAFLKLHKLGNFLAPILNSWLLMVGYA